MMRPCPRAVKRAPEKAAGALFRGGRYLYALPNVAHPGACLRRGRSDKSAPMRPIGEIADHVAAVRKAYQDALDRELHKLAKAYGRANVEAAQRLADQDQA